MGTPPGTGDGFRAFTIQTPLDVTRKKLQSVDCALPLSACGIRLPDTLTNSSIDLSNTWLFEKVMEREKRGNNTHNCSISHVCKRFIYMCY